MGPTPQLPRQAPRRHSKRRLAFFGACQRVAQLLGGRRFYRWRSLTPGRLVLRQETVCAPDLPESLEGFTVLHLSDIHAGPFLGAGDLGGLRKLLGKRIPDLLVFTGDYITTDHRDVLPMLPELGRIPRRLGALAVFGNHDYRFHEEHLLRAGLLSNGIECLQDEGRQVADLPLWISGLNDLEESPRQDLQAARAGMPAGHVEIVLCHNPLGARELAGERTIAILSGHSHGRQIDLPLLRDLGPVHPGLSVGLGATTLLVNRGLGVVGVPVRVGAPAEALWLELRRGPAVAGRKTRFHGVG